MCSKELSGRSCAASYAYEWHASVHSCALTFVPGCPTCPAVAGGNASVFEGPGVVERVDGPAAKVA